MEQTEDDESGKYQIRVSGTPAEEAAALTGQVLMVDERVEKLRSFLVQYFCHVHGKGVTDSADNTVANSNRVSLQLVRYNHWCSVCTSTTSYYMYPRPQFKSPLCLSTPCLYKIISLQQGDQSYEDTTEEDCKFTKRAF